MGGSNCKCHGQAGGRISSGVVRPLGIKRLNSGTIESSHGSGLVVPLAARISSLQSGLSTIAQPDGALVTLQMLSGSAALGGGTASGSQAAGTAALFDRDVNGGGGDGGRGSGDGKGEPRAPVCPC